MAGQTEVHFTPGDVWRERVRKRWGWVLALGGLFTLLGVVGLGMLFSATPASMTAFGVLLVGGSVAHTVQIFRAQGWRNMAVQALIAVLYLVTAVLVLVDPVAASLSLKLVLGTFLVGVGVLRIIGGIDAKPLPGWGWVLTTGVADLLLGVMVFIGWPVTGLWVIGLFISIDLLISGLGYVMLSFRLRTAERGALPA